MRRYESSFESLDGLELYFQEWMPVSAAKAHLIITHGLGEHSDCYEEFVDQLRDYDLRVSAWDLRGHGHSQGPRGAIADLYSVSQDFETFLRRVLKIGSSPVPVFLMGHSMGGLIVLKSLLGLRDYLHLPLILSSPFLGLSLPVPEWKRNSAEVLALLAPSFTLNNEIHVDDLTRDPARRALYERDSLRHDRISAGLYESALKAIETVFFQAQSFQAPTLLIGSDSDPVVSSTEMQAFAKHLKHPQQKAVFLPDRKHEVFNDKGREEAFSHLRRFLEENSSLRAKRRPYRPLV